MAANAEHRDDKRYLENREINEQRFTVFTLSGRMEAEHVAELKGLFDRYYRNIVLDLRDVRLADRDAVRFLRGCEADRKSVV